MKRFFLALCAALILALGAGCLAEAAGGEAWKLDYYLDEFKLPTDDAYITNAEPIDGTFCNSEVEDAPLRASVFVDEHLVSFQLFENGNSKVRNHERTEKLYNITMLDDARQRTYLLGAMSANGGDRLYLAPYDGQDIIAALTGNATLRFYIEEAENPGTNYLFALDTAGFKAAFDELQNTIHERYYQQAVELYEAGEYKRALAIFVGLGDYKDSADWLPRYQEMKYGEAEALLAEGKYAEANDAFIEAGDYSDAASRVGEPYYAQAEALLAEGDYAGAVDAFSAAGEYSDAARRIPETNYAYAEALLAANEPEKAAIAFGCAGNYKDARVRSFALWDQVAQRSTIAAGNVHTVGLKSDGTVVAIGGDYYGQCDVSDWTDIVAVSAGDVHTVGLKSDGSVVAVGTDYNENCNVSSWTDIVAIAAGFAHTVGLKSDGTVVAVGTNSKNQCDVSDWTDIVAIAAGNAHTVGLKSDGTVVAVGNNYSGQCDVSDWTDIVAVAAGDAHTVGLKSNGSVVSTYHDDVSGWSDIVAVAAGEYHTVGLKSNGSVVSTNRDDVSGWRDVVAVAAGEYHTVGLKSNGSVVAVGDNDHGQCNVSSWRWYDIRLPHITDAHSPGAPESTVVPTPAPTEEPAAGTINFTISGQSVSGTAELIPGKHEISWAAQGDVQSYFIYLYDGSGNLLQSAENSELTGCGISTNSMIPGEVYELRVGALPANGNREDICWQSLYLTLPIAETPKPTEIPPLAPAANEGGEEDGECLTVGSRGDAVTQLQRALINKGLLSGTPDGKFGIYTAEAVRNMQKIYGMEQTGIADQAFLERLYADQ